MNARTGPTSRNGGAWRCFVGLPLPESWNRSLERIVRDLADRLAARVSWTRPGNWHLTVKFLGDVEPERVPDVAAALAGAPFAAFVLRLGAAGFFPPRGAPRVIWAGLSAGAEEAARLAAGVEAALAPLGFAPEGRPFAAHLTLGRVRGAAVRGDAWDAVGAALARETFEPASVRRMVLWRSVLSPGGPRYSVLRTFAAA